MARMTNTGLQKELTSIFQEGQTGNINDEQHDKEPVLRMLSYLYSGTYEMRMDMLDSASTAMTADTAITGAVAALSLDNAGDAGDKERVGDC